MNYNKSGKRETWRFSVLLTFLIFCLLFIDFSSAYALSLEQEEKLGQEPQRGHVLKVE